MQQALKRFSRSRDTVKWAEGHIILARIELIRHTGYRPDHLQRAGAYAQAAIDALQGASEPAAVARARRELATVLMEADAGDRTELLQALSPDGPRGLESAQETEAFDLHGRAAIILHQTEHDAAELAHAIEGLRRAVAIWAARGDATREDVSTLMLAQALLLQDDVDPALAWDQAIVLFERVYARASPGRDIRSWLDSRLTFAVALLESGRSFGDASVERAVDIVNEVGERLDEIRTPELRARALADLGGVAAHPALGEAPYDAAVGWVAEATEIARRSGLRRGGVDWGLRLAMLLRERARSGDLEQAEDAARAALTAAVTPDQRGRALIELATVRRRQDAAGDMGGTAEAIALLRAALALEPPPFRSTRQFAAAALAEALADRGEHAAAAAAAEQASRLVDLRFAAAGTELGVGASSVVPFGEAFGGWLSAERAVRTLEVVVGQPSL